MSSIPREYASWLPLLDRFRDGDDTVLELMRQGSVEWSNVVAERWTSRVASAMEARLKAVSQQLQLGFNRAGGDIFAVGCSLLNARRALQPLRHFALIPCLPEKVSDHLKSELERWIRETQETLEKNAREIRTDNGRLLKAIRDNSLAKSAENNLSPSSTAAETPPARKGRRIIL